MHAVPDDDLGLNGFKLVTVRFQSEVNQSR
jgi:hypothetical protein